MAGSERIAKTGASGKVLEEAKKINLSLTSLGICIKSLTDGSAHVPFRDSKLTFFLKDALGGNSKTTLICTASKQMVHLEESVQTLKFAQRAKRIMNKANANVQRSPKEMEELIKKLKIEVSTLKSQLLELGIAPRAPDKSINAAGSEATAAVAKSDPKIQSTPVSKDDAKEETKSGMEVSDALANPDNLFDHLPKHDEPTEKASRRDSITLTKK